MRKIFLTCWFLMTISGSVMSQSFLSLATDAFVGIKIPDIIKQLNMTANSAIAQGYNSGDLLLANAGNRMRVMTRNLDLIAKERSQDIFSKTDIIIFQVLNDIVGLNNSISTGIYKTGQNINNGIIDILFVADGIKPSRSKEFFMITNIDRTVLYPTDNLKDYQIIISGLGMSNSKNIKIQHIVKLDNAVIPESYVVHLDKNRLGINIPKSFLDKSFSETTIDTVNIRVEAKITHDSFFGKKNYDLDHSNFTVFLYPKKPGKIQIKEYISQSVWGPEKLYQTIHYSYPRNNGHNVIQFSSAVAADERITRCEFICKGQTIITSWKGVSLRDYLKNKVHYEELRSKGFFESAEKSPGSYWYLREANTNNTCGWCFNADQTGYAVDATYNSDRTQVVLQRVYTNDDFPLNISHEIYYQKKEDGSPIEFNSTAIEMDYLGDKAYYLQKDNINYQINLKWFDGTSETYYSGGSINQKYIKCQLVQEGDRKKLVFNVSQVF